MCRLLNAGSTDTARPAQPLCEDGPRSWSGGWPFQRHDLLAELRDRTPRAGAWGTGRVITEVVAAAPLAAMGNHHSVFWIEALRD